MSKMKNNKAAGPDEIVAEMVSALDDFGLQKLTECLNEIYDTGEIPEELSKSIFIALPKKAGAIECELHRTISLMSHIIKILLRIIMLRARSRIMPEIGEEQCGFVQGAGQGRIETFSTFSIENVRFSQFDYSNYNAKSNE